MTVELTISPVRPSRSEERKARSTVDRLLRDICVPAGCLYPQEVKGLLTCSAGPANKYMAVIRALQGGSGCNLAYSAKGPGTVHPDGTFAPRLVE